MTTTLRLHACLGLCLGLCLSLAALCAPGPGLCMGQRPQAAPAGTQNATDPAFHELSSPAGMAPETGAGAAKPGKQPAAKPGPDDEDASRSVQVAQLRSYYQRMMTLDETFPEVFSRRVREEEAMGFMMMCEQQRRKGLLPRFRAARVYLEDLRFTRITADPDMARFRVRGTYSISVGTAFETVEENALFVLLPEEGAWKIFERRDASD